LLADTIVFLKRRIDPKASPIDHFSRCSSVRDVLTGLKALFEFASRSPTDYWLSSQAYFKHACSCGLSNDRLQYKEWESAGENTRNPARTLHRPHPLFDPASPFVHGKYPSTFAICIPGGRLAGGRGSVIAHDGNLLFDVSIDWSAGGHDAARHPLLRQKKLARAERLAGVSTVLATSESARFFHWMTDAFPRLQILQKASPVPWEEIDHFVISEGISALRESLSLLGIREERVVVSRPDSHFLCDWLIVPSLPGAPGNVPPWVVHFLRSQFLKSPLATGGNRIYLSRAKASGRRMLNEEEIWPILSSRGFLRVTLEDLSLADQIGLFAEAEAIVAPHGAGLTNLAWCPPKTKVVEIFSPLYVNLCYWAMSSLTQADYYYLLGSADGLVDDVNDARFFLEDISVDPLALARTLEAMEL
jgi:capsular polysaccharide biosynthesis protein